MSIVRLLKVSMIGLSAEKDIVMENLQTLGSLHIIPLERRSTASSSQNPHGREALQFLLASPQKYRQIINEKYFDPEQIQHQALQLRKNLDALIAERDRLVTLIEERRPWGNFKPPASDALKGAQLWLYKSPAYQRRLFESLEAPWEVVAHDNRFDYIAVISNRQPAPDAMPISTLSPDPRSLTEMELRLEELELAIDEAQSQRNSLSRWCLLLGRSLDRLEDVAALQAAKEQTRDTESIFALQAWLPRDQLQQLRSFAEDRAIVLEVSEPDPSETPPTKFSNPERIAGGEELVAFYMTPSYWLCDPSPAVFFAFGLFFAMIMSDAGYGLILAAMTGLLWKRLGGSAVARRWRVLLVWITGLTILYGVLVGSYFGVAPRSQFLKSLHLVEMKNYRQMMILSALIGCVHLTFANLMNAWRYRGSTRLLAPLGWALMIDGGMTLVLSSGAASSAAKNTGIGLCATGLIFVLLFSAPGERVGRRLLTGLLGLTKVTSAFGDVLSYLRLFALGLASASLAAVFNGIASGLYHKIAGLGLLLAIVVLTFGHVVNLFLSVSSGFIHGLRLNVIEFFNWGVPEEGNVFRPFLRKETVTWKR